MDYMVYLLNMRVAGIKSIEKEINIDFYGKTIDRRFNPDKYRIKGIYGENGTGKTAIIAAVDIINKFIFSENYLRDPQQQLLLKELINKKSKTFSFHCEFVTNIEVRVIYEYDLVLQIDADSDEIYVAVESLKYKEKYSKNATKTMFLCEKGEFTELNFPEKMREYILEKSRNLLIKQSAMYSIFSISKVEDFEFDTQSVMYLVYAIIFFVMVDTYFDREDQHMDYYHKCKIESLKNTYNSTEKIIDELLNEKNFNESRVPIKLYNNYEKSIKRLEKFVKFFKPELKKIDIEKKENKTFYECELLLDYGEYRVNKEFESTGIKKIMNLYNTLENASKGGIVFIDELDSNINDIYLCKIIEYFMHYGQGQICFTSHNTDPMKVLKENNKSIDFLTRDNNIVPWVKNGHYMPDVNYRNGMIKGLPFNIDATDFIGIFEEAR